MNAALLLFGQIQSSISMQSRLLAAIWLSSFLVSLDYSAVNVALPTLAREFDAGTSDVAWIALSYQTVVVALTLTTGVASSRIGYLRALAWSLGLFAIASLASAASSTLWALVGMRILQGVGASVMFAIGPAVIMTMFQSKTHNRAFAIFSTAPTAGLCGGPALGGQLTSMFGWEAIFLLSLAAALLAIGLVLSVSTHATLRARQDAPPASQRVNLASVALASAGLLTLVLGLNQGQEWDWTSPPILLLFAGSIGAFSLLVLKERHSSMPIVDAVLFASPGFLHAGAVLFLALVAFGGGVFLMPFYFEWLWKLDINTVGLLLMVQPVATIAVSILAGLTLVEISRRALCSVGVSLFVMGLGVFVVASRDAGLAVFIVGLCLMGAGQALFYPTLMQISMAGVPDHLAASASGLQASARSLAQLLGVALFETVFSGIFPAAQHAEVAASASGTALLDMQSAFRTVFCLGVGFAVAALLLAVMLVDTPKSSGGQSKPERAEGEA
jgi:EmrB/QacA subfamily drug resistance transporter